MENSNSGTLTLPSSIDVHSMSSRARKLAAGKMTQDAPPTIANDDLHFGRTATVPPTTNSTPAATPAPFGSPTMSMLSSVVSYDEDDNVQKHSSSSPLALSSSFESHASNNSSCYHSCHSVPQQKNPTAPTLTGWEKTQSLLSERNKIQRKLQKALVGCAKESKRLDQMEVSLRSFEGAEGDRDRANLHVARGASKDTSTTCTTRSSGDDESASQSSASSGSNCSAAGGANDSTVVSCDSSDGEDEDVPSQHLENCYLPTKYDGPRTAPAPGPAATGRSWSMIYDDMRRLSSQCSTMQRQLDVKNIHIEQLYNDNQAIIRRFERAKENHRKIQKKYESLIKKMCTKQCAELSAKDETIKEQRGQIQDREDVIQKLLDANKKLEVALGAMTTAANNAIKAKNKVREDLKLLRSSQLRDIINRNEKNSIPRE